MLYYIVVATHFWFPKGIFIILDAGIILTKLGLAETYLQIEVIPTVVVADAHYCGIFRAIPLTFPNEAEKSVSPTCWMLSSAENNHGQNEKEAVALVIATKKINKFL